MAAVCLDMCALYALCLVLLLGKRAWLAGPSIYLYWNDTFDWQQSDGNASIVRITSTGVADDEGNVYVAGSITSINPEDGSEGDDNVFVGCINEDDEIFWTQENETDAAEGFAMMNEISSDGSATQWLFMVAATWDYMGEGAHALNGFGQIDVRDVMVLKLTLDGDKVWARQLCLWFGTTANDYAYGVVVDCTANALLLSGG